MLSNLGKVNIKQHMWLIDVRIDCWATGFLVSCVGTDFLLPVWKNRELRKQLRQWAWMAVSQAYQTPGLGLNSSPPVGEKRPTAMEVAVGQRHLWLNTKIFRYGWTLQRDIFNKMPNLPTFSSYSSFSGEMDVTTLGDLKGGSAAVLAVPVSCRPFYVFSI